MGLRLALALAVAAQLGSAAAGAQTVTLQGMLGNRALLIVDGKPPKGVAPGDTHAGVRVISTSADAAVVEIAGQRQVLRLGEAPASVGAAGVPPRGSRIVLTAGSGGHFMASGAINGRAAQFVVDTGATFVSMGAADAQRFGVDWKAGQIGSAQTANGVMPAWRVKLASLRIGDVELFDVDALVSQQPIPAILLGNSFLNRFHMKRDHEQMVLERRY
ncbi:retropepsin-like aspartic protease family protein [Ramlibacter lithotrophicus]|nr:TIGR02281 family clan AA aspartic protease [Ramlibacter lithotrophicus]